MRSRMIALSVLTLCAVAAAFGQHQNVSEVVHISNKDILADPAVLHGKHLVSTGQPDKDTLAIAADAGITTIIDLRTAGEDRGIDEEAETVGNGMTYVSFPIAGTGDMTMEKAAEFDALLAKIDGPVLMHCGSGNRVGAMFALRASLKGASSEEALRVGDQAGLTRSRDAVEEKLVKAQP